MKLAEAERLFHCALGLPTAQERAAYLRNACAGNPTLHEQVERLLQAHEANASLLPTEPGDRTVVVTPSEGPGTVIGRYKLLQQIGEGGMGVVYMAEQEEPVRRRVALKIIKLGMDTKQVVARFEAERQALALMDHPNIAKVLDGGATETGRPYFVMELVQGVPITDFCAKAKLNAQARLKLFISVCQAIQSAHQKGVIHRDIKPSNVLVTLHDGVPVPKVIDFGIAKATNQKLTEKTLFTNFATMIGTPAYMSPEQAEMSGLDIDTRSDIYALGVLLYELLTSTTPFPEKRLRSLGYGEMQRVIVEEEPERPSTRLSTMASEQQTSLARHCGEELSVLTSLLRGDLDWIVMKCLEKERGRRYETANALAADLQRHLGNEPVSARPPSAAYRFGKAIRRNKLAWMSGLSLATILLASSTVSLWLAQKATRNERDAVRARAGESRQREQAQSAQKQAEAEAAKSKEALATSDFLQAVGLVDRDKAGEAVAYLARCLRTEPKHEAAAARLATLLAYRSWCLPLCPPMRDPFNLSELHFSPDGNRVWTCSMALDCCYLRVWDARKGTPASDHLKQGSWQGSTAFSPDGVRFLVGSTNEGWIVNVQTGVRIVGPFKHDKALVAIQFSPDGSRVVSAGADKTVRIWDAHTGRLLQSSIKADDWISSVEFSSDGTKVLTASGYYGAQVWDPESGKPVSQPILDSGLESAEFSPSGALVLTSSFAGKVRLWNANTGQQLGDTMVHRDRAQGRFSQDGSRVVTSSADRTARVWDALTGKPIGGPMEHQGYLIRASLNSNGRYSLTGCSDGTAQIWDATTTRRLAEPLHHPDRVEEALFSPDGTRILTGSTDKAARLWSFRKEHAEPELFDSDGASSRRPLPARLRTLFKPRFVDSNNDDEDRYFQRMRSYSAKFSPDGQLLAASSQSNSVIVWDPHIDESTIHALAHESRVRAVQFSPNGRYVATASDDKTARVWDARSGRAITAPLMHEGRVRGASFSPDNRRLVTASDDHTARVWDVESGQSVLTSLIHPDAVVSAEFNRDATWILTTSGDFVVRIWDANTGRMLNDSIKEMAVARLSRDGKRIAAGLSMDVQVWDVQSWKPLGEPMRLNHAFTSLQFNPGGDLLLTGSRDNSARLWDSQSGKPRTDWLRHDDVVYSARFDRGGRWVVTASEDGTARIWDARSGQPVTDPMPHVEPVCTAQFSPDSRRVVTAAADGSTRIWDFAPPTDKAPAWLPKLAEAVSGLALNSEGLVKAIDGYALLQEVREILAKEPDNDDWAIWGRWVLADPDQRTISPFSKRRPVQAAARKP